MLEVSCKWQPQLSAARAQTTNRCGSQKSRIEVRSPSIRSDNVQSCRRDVPGFVRTVCKCVLQKILVDRDTDGAVEASKGMIRRLVGGKCSMSDLVMTGGLWRVNDEDITRVAGEGS